MRSMWKLHQCRCRRRHDSCRWMQRIVCTRGVVGCGVVWCVVYRWVDRRSAGNWCIRVRHVARRTSATLPQRQPQSSPPPPPSSPTIPHDTHTPRPPATLSPPACDPPAPAPGSGTPRPPGHPSWRSPAHTPRDAGRVKGEPQRPLATLMRTHLKESKPLRLRQVGALRFGHTPLVGQIHLVAHQHHQAVGARVLRARARACGQTDTVVFALHTLSSSSLAGVWQRTLNSRSQLRTFLNDAVLVMSYKMTPARFGMREGSRRR